MKQNILTIATTAILMVAVFSTSFAQAVKVKVNNLSVKGSSTLHDWESQVTTAEWKGIIDVQDHQLLAIKFIEVKIPVESIKSTKGKMMDSKTYDAFRSEEFPFIVFSMTSATINAQQGVIDAKGYLTMNGEKRPIDLQAKYKMLPGDEVQISLNETMLMTDFKMVPPTAMMGSIKVGDEITVAVDITVTSKLIQ